MENDSTGVSIREPLLDRPNDVQVVTVVVEAAIVGKTIQELADLLLGFHVRHLDLMQRSYAMSAIEPEYRGQVSPDDSMGDLTPFSQRAKATSANISAVSQTIEYSMVRRAHAPSTRPMTPRRANSRKPSPSTAAAEVYAKPAS